VGKILVSDVILNKPGRLTDEEFEIMKTHTTAGERVISSAMALVSDSGYLKEAKNLATYHHERWDGTGYPSGKKGEEIPLSARIMAVADVFDALVSKRSYKEPFPFEKAMDIIKEGAGTQFDPEIAEIFIESAEEARAISQAHESMNGQNIREMER
jgi:HD-GYP domain-containing protein (c-di-GMP phosphodiesterase class II)